ncbi:MAG: hypothetical protein U0165_03440 [Polyangiaceae bacterium]
MQIAKQVGLVSSVVFASLLSVGLAFADVAQPAPLLCPPGTKGVSGHQSVCRPEPPSNCPPGYLPRVYGNEAYCEAPPAVACPVGSRWVSWGSHNSFCLVDQPELPSWSCQGTSVSTETSLCVVPMNGHRIVFEEAKSVCSSDSDCSSFPGAKCIKQKRCIPPGEHADEEARVIAAKSSPAPPPPRSYSPILARCACSMVGESSSNEASLAWAMMLLGAALYRRGSRRRS